MASKNTVEIILAAKDKASRAVQSALGTVKTSAGAAMGAITAGAAAAGAAMITLSGVVSKVGISYNAMLEQSEVAWTTLLGTQENAQKMLKQISDFTKATPFETADVDMMAKYMHNAGLEGQKLFEELLKVSDVASAFAIPAAEAKEMTRQMSQVRQAGVAYTEDLNILQDRGVPIFKAIAEQQGIMVKDVKKMASEGKLTSDIYIDAFNNIAKGAEGASKAQSKTFNGMISTLKDNLKMISGELTKGAFERLKSTLETIMPYVEKFNEGLSKNGLRGALEAVVPPQVMDDIDRLIDGFNIGKEAVLSFIESVKVPILGYIEYMRSLFQGDGNLGQTFTRIFETVKSIAVPILEDAVNFIKGILDKLKTFWDENGAQIVQAVQNFWSVISSIFQAIAPVLLFIIQMVWGSIKGVISGALDVIMGLIKIFAGLFTGDFSKMWEGIKQLFSGAIEAVWNLINLLMFGRILGGIKAFVTSGASSFSSFWTKTVEIFKNLDNNVIGIIKGLISKGKSNFDDLLSSAKSIFGKVKEAITNPIKTAKDTVIGFIDKIKSALSNMTVKIPLPHFSVSNFSLNPKDWVTKGIPKLSVDWYDKGGVFYGPQIIGVGEKRPEFVGALDDLRKIVREETKGVQVIQESKAPEYAIINIDGRQAMMAMIDYFIEEQDFRKHRERGFSGA